MLQTKTPDQTTKVWPGARYDVFALLGKGISLAGP